MLFNVLSNSGRGRRQATAHCCVYLTPLLWRSRRRACRCTQRRHSHGTASVIIFMVQTAVPPGLSPRLGDPPTDWAPPSPMGPAPGGRDGPPPAHINIGPLSCPTTDSVPAPGRGWLPRAAHMFMCTMNTVPIDHLVIGPYHLRTLQTTGHGGRGGGGAAVVAPHLQGSRSSALRNASHRWARRHVPIQPAPSKSQAPCPCANACTALGIETTRRRIALLRTRSQCKESVGVGARAPNESVIPGVRARPALSMPLPLRTRSRILLVVHDEGPLHKTAPPPGQVKNSFAGGGGSLEPPKIVGGGWGGKGAPMTAQY